MFVVFLQNTSQTSYAVLRQLLLYTGVTLAFLQSFRTVPSAESIENVCENWGNFLVKFLDVRLSGPAAFP